MNKFFILFFFLCSIGFSNAQDTIVKEEPPKIATVKYTEKDIQIDSEAVEAKHFKTNFKKKYTGPDFTYEFKTPEKNWWDLFKEWLASLLRDLFSLGTTEASLNFASILIRVVAVIVIILVIYFIVKALINKEGQWIFGKNANKRTIYYSDIEKNIHLLDFDKLIKESIQAGEKRAAIRYYYLWLLKVMAQNRYIEWDIEKTNSDYLYELQKPEHKEEFTYLSYLYNYIWYGEFEIDETTFAKAENRFKNALKIFGNE
ncbi:hypothetical protein EV144_1011279 [Flavobacterium sp. 270]|uniref:DUF4129 domain-containing protein n=1 Tax=Flavobacterium sp. 270 TaxID=2512114 RepID=UPI001065037F|nr:DUF4129 domain-containing protein [Flavobacterium sp. 270]TDW52588.1 hypothetical protein EV144_1011279 [Flavobacterium sp. 270]